MSFIEGILEEKGKEIVRRMRAVPSGELEKRLGEEPVRDFARAVSGRGRIIAEIKRKSPARKSYLWSSRLQDLPLAYEQNGASALSVVADSANFGITLEEARSLRTKTRLPMLIKDFIVDPYQILAARASNADAVLLIARILSVERLASLLGFAHKLGMHAIVEIHSIADLEKAVSVRASIIGINNRDLDTLTVDTETTRKLMPHVPERTITVSESGIRERKEIESLIDAGVNAFLIGEALLDSLQPGLKLRELAGLDGSSMPRGRQEQ